IQHNALIANNLGGSGTAISARSELGGVEIDANSMSGHGFKSLELDATYSSDVAITGNSSVSDGPMDLQNVHGGVVSGNTVTGSSGSGLSLAGGNSDVSVHANDITGSNGSGVSLATGPGGTNQAISVVGNNLTGNHQYAISEGPAAMSGTLQAHFNRIFNNTVGGVFNDPANTTINAESNWWGCNEGPPGAFCQGIGNDVDFTPWLVLRATAERGRVLTGGDTTPVRTGFSLSSALTQQVDASDFPATPVGFVATLGTVQSPATTSSGVAQTLFTSGATPGTGSVTATLDNGGASANFEVSSQAGAQGTQGPPGPQGDPGPKGDTGDPGPSTPSSPAQPNPVLVLSNTLRATKQRIVSISVSCPNAAGLCDGRLGLGVGSSTLGNTAFLVNGGNRAVLRLKVSAAGLKAAIKKKKVTVVVLSRDNAGTAAFTTKVVKFRK
ncbi:MAG: hypothetical protein QOG41_2072, partial [Thermoleophilaceae bacterium]|nr:hypothetical protein [Thermoleophilaceae bacterium]